MPDRSFIDRCNKLQDSIQSTSDEQIDQLLKDAKQFGDESIEMAYALSTKGRRARWMQENLKPGAHALEQAVAIAQTNNIEGDVLIRWLRVLCYIQDDLVLTVQAIDTAEKIKILSSLHKELLTPETLAGNCGLLHTMRCAMYPVLPELQELAVYWPSTYEDTRQVQLDVLKRIAQRRKDLSEQEVDCLGKLSVEPDGISKALPPPEPKANTGELQQVLDELGALIGLHEVKAEFQRLAAVLQVEEMRRAKELPVAPRSNHMVFLGPPGTGKTTVARLLGRLYKSLGILARGQVIEIDRSGLTAGYVGQTAIKTNEAIDSALDGVLFIDEAYTLFNSYEKDFGHEAVATLLKRMEDDRARLVVVLAGYDEPMLQMLGMNPGLKSRINTTLKFNAYSAVELTKIFEQQVVHSGYELTAQASERVREICGLMKGSEDPGTFGNAREIRNLFEDTIARQSERIVMKTSSQHNPSSDELQRLEADDIHWEYLGNESLRNTLSNDQLYLVAVHEMGHALVGHLVDGPPPVLVTTIPSSYALGLTFFAEEESPVFTRSQLVGRAARALGGRAAEEIVFNQFTSGAAQDLMLAERIAMELLRTGMSEVSAQESLEDYAATSEPTAGQGAWKSERTRQEIADLLQEAYALALGLIQEHTDILKRSVEHLMAKRTLNQATLSQLLGQRPEKGDWQF